MSLISLFFNLIGFILFGIKNFFVSIYNFIFGVKDDTDQEDRNDDYPDDGNDDYPDDGDDDYLDDSNEGNYIKELEVIHINRIGSLMVALTMFIHFRAFSESLERDNLVINNLISSVIQAKKKALDKLINSIFGNNVNTYFKDIYFRVLLARPSLFEYLLSYDFKLEGISQIVSDSFIRNSWFGLHDNIIFDIKKGIVNFILNNESIFEGGASVLGINVTFDFYNKDLNNLINFFCISNKLNKVKLKKVLNANKFLVDILYRLDYTRFPILYACIATIIDDEANFDTLEYEVKEIIYLVLIERNLDNASYLYRSLDNNSGLSFNENVIPLPEMDDSFSLFNIVDDNLIIEEEQISELEENIEQIIEEESDIAEADAKITELIINSENVANKKVKDTLYYTIIKELESDIIEDRMSIIKSFIKKLFNEEDYNNFDRDCFMRILLVRPSLIELIVSLDLTSDIIINLVSTIFVQNTDSGLFDNIESDIVEMVVEVSQNEDINEFIILEDSISEEDDEVIFEEVDDWLLSSKLNRMKNESNDIKDVTIEENKQEAHENWVGFLLRDYNPAEENIENVVVEENLVEENIENVVVEENPTEEIIIEEEVDDWRKSPLLMLMLKDSILADENIESSIKNDINNASLSELSNLVASSVPSSNDIVEENLAEENIENVVVEENPEEEFIEAVPGNFFRFSIRSRERDQQIIDELDDITVDERMGLIMTFIFNLFNEDEYEDYERGPFIRLLLARPSLIELMVSLNLTPNSIFIDTVRESFVENESKGSFDNIESDILERMSEINTDVEFIAYPVRIQEEINHYDILQKYDIINDLAKEKEAKEKDIIYNILEKNKGIEKILNKKDINNILKDEKSFYLLYKWLMKKVTIKEITDDFDL